MESIITLSVTRGLTQDQWIPVYEEALSLAEHFPLAEFRYEEIINHVVLKCLVKSREREYTSPWGNSAVGLRVEFDSVTKSSCEPFFMKRNLCPAESSVRISDPLYKKIRPYDRSIPDTRSVWAGQTSRGSLHAYILAISCLVADRLKDNAYVDGDISLYEFKEAVSLANCFLKRKISMPVQCVKESLLARIQKMPLPRHEQLREFLNIYNGVTDKNTGDFLRSEFTEEECDSCWKEIFDARPNSFRYMFWDYLSMGFDFEKLFRYVNFPGPDDRGSYEEFIHSFLNLYLSTQQADVPVLPLSRNADPSSLAYRLAQFVQHDKFNRWVGHQIGIESFIEILEERIGQYCNVSEIIEKWLDQKDKSLKENRYSEKIKEMEDKYDIVDPGQLRDFRKGNTVEPELSAKAIENTALWIEIAQRPDCTALMENDPFDLCQWLADKNRSRLLTADEWKKIFDDILADPETFRRYAPMVKLYGNYGAADDYINAMALNDDFYEEMIRLCKDDRQA